MNSFLSLAKNKKGAVLMTAIAFMTIVVALCGIVTTFILAMSKTTASYTSVNENKIVADCIAADFMSYCKEETINDSFTNLYDKYSDYTLVYFYSSAYCSTEANEPDNDSGYNYYCYAYESSSSSTPLIYIEIKKDSDTYEYTRYEYGNI